MYACIREGNMPKEFRTGLTVPEWKRKGNVHNLEKNRGLILLSHTLKLLGRS